MNIAVLAVSCLALLSFASACTTEASKPPGKGGSPLVAKYVKSLQTIDTDSAGDDPQWQGIQPLHIEAVGVWGDDIGKVQKVTLKASYTDSHIAVLAIWDDPTRDDNVHRPWVWNAQTKGYEQGKEQEDAVALAFEHTGPFTADMLSHVDAVWDIWTWKATRTDPVGYAQDKTHRFHTQKPQGSAKEYKSRTGEPIWIQRPEDSGTSVQKPQKAPAEHGEDVVPQYVAQVPSGSAADVRARGTWHKGRWTVELIRKLDTGNGDDTAFDPQRSYLMAVAVQDRTGDMGKASPVIRLSFGTR